jgi:hypothetical protein
MVDWSEVERVQRDGEDVIENVNEHRLVKIFRLRDGSKYLDRARMNLGEDESIPREERKYKTAWKCEKCGVEVGGAASSASHIDCDSD